MKVKDSSLSILLILGINILSAQNLDSLMVSVLFTADPVNLNGYSLKEDTLYIIRNRNSINFNSHGKQFVYLNKEESNFLSKKRRVLVIDIEHLGIENNCVLFDVLIGSLNPSKEKNSIKFIELFSRRRLGCCYDVNGNKFEVMTMD